MKSEERGVRSEERVMLSEAKHLQQMAGDSSPAARNDRSVELLERLVAEQRRTNELLERLSLGAPAAAPLAEPGTAYRHEADGRTYQNFAHFIRANPGLDFRQLRAAKQEWDMQRGITKNKGRRPRI